jgi:hypothetical protein
MRWIVILGLLGGCSAGAFDNAADDPGAGGSGGGGNSGAGPVCGQPGPMVDPNSLPACCADPGSTGAHCVPANLVPGGVSSALATCQGGSCVPDKFIRAGGVFKPPSCKSLGGADGVCLSICIPQVAQYKDLLPQANCDGSERCAPCTNPLNNMPSGACDIGNCNAMGGGTGGAGGAPPPMCPHQGPPVLDPATLPACDQTVCPAGGAHCVQGALVPTAEQALLGPCPNNGFCAPDPFIAAGGQYVPPNCASLLGAEGRCLSTCIPKVAQQAAMLPQATCGATEKCVPCYDPIAGMPTGACNISCDPGPTRPATVFPNCCSDRGRCVPTTSIPQALQSNLDHDSCADGNLCVPSENLQPTFVPPACEADGFLIGHYTGVCLSDCLKFGLQGIVLAQGNCTDQHKCAPCRNPLSGQATGAPGCPP